MHLNVALNEWSKEDLIQLCHIQVRNMHVGTQMIVLEHIMVQCGVCSCHLLLWVTSFCVICLVQLWSQKSLIVELTTYSEFICNTDFSRQRREEVLPNQLPPPIIIRYCYYYASSLALGG